MDNLSYQYHDDSTMHGADGERQVQHRYRKRSSSTNTQSRDFCTKRQKDVICGSYRTTTKDDLFDLPHVEQSMEVESLSDSVSNNKNSLPLHQRSINDDNIYQQIVNQFSIGSGSLLLDDQHLLDSTTMDDVVNATLQDQVEWLEMVVYARQRAKAWDSTQYMRERNALKSWLR